MFKYRKGLFISLLIGLTLSSSLSEATVPNAPGSYVGISKLSNTSVRISTKDNSDNEDGFYVSVYDYETSNLVQRKQISDSNNSHIYADFTGLVCDKLYLANILAFNEDGNSSVSDTRNFNIHTTFSTTCPDDIDVPTAPGAYIGVTDINKSAVRVNFLDNSDNEDGFLLFDESGDINITIPANNVTAPSQTYVTLTGLTSDRTYTIRALAFNTNGNSEMSDAQTFNIHTTFGVYCHDNYIKIDLSRLKNWTNKPNDAVENNVFNGTQYQGVWDDTLNWFEFRNKQTKGVDRVLGIPFCACGNTLVDIKNFKADNNATIKLDSTLVVSQQGYDQEAMRRDDMGGKHVDGSQSVLGTGTGVNHTLRVDVHNSELEFGVAIEGTLKFRGNLGLCFKTIDNYDKE